MAKAKITKRNIELYVSDITLLTEDEYRAAKDLIPVIFDYWWLQTQTVVAEEVEYVEGDTIRDSYVTEELGVRPVLLISPLYSGLKTGDKVELWGYTWTAIESNKILCDDIIATERFDVESGYYKYSEIRSFLKKWLKSKTQDDEVSDFEIYFSDLNEDAQKRLMEAVGISNPSEMNWDIDMCPLAIYPVTEPDD